MDKTAFFKFVSDNKHNEVTSQHSAQRKHAFMVKTKEKSKSTEKISKKTVSLEILYQRLGHISTESVQARDTTNVWQDIDIRIYPDHSAHHVKFPQ